MSKTDYEIKESIHKIRLESMRIEEELKSKEMSLENQLAEVQELCPHSRVSFYNDPSGNNDSFYECNVCSKEFKSLPKKKQ